MKTVEYAYVVGLDWGDEEHAFAVQALGGGEVENGTIEASAEQLHGWLDRLEQRVAGERRIAVAIESGRWGLLHALVAHPRVDVYPVNPATSARFRKAFSLAGAKDDAPDAVVLLRLLVKHGEQLRPLLLDTALTRELQALVRVRRDAVGRRTGLTNELGALLKSYFPQALRLAGADLSRPLALEFLRRWPELAALRSVRPATLRAFYARHNVRRPELIEQRLQLVAGARALTEDRAVIEPARLQLGLLCDELSVLQKHIAVCEARIERVFASHPKAVLFRELPGAGPALAPRLLVAFGDHPQRYPDAASLQKQSGTAPVKEKSGGKLWIHWRRGAPRFLRQTFVEWAGQTVVYSTWAKAYYWRQKQAGKAHHAILRALAFKWQRILWRCWRDNTPYDESRYLAALARHKSPIALAS